MAELGEGKWRRAILAGPALGSLTALSLVLIPLGPAALSAEALEILDEPLSPFYYPTDFILQNLSFGERAHNRSMDLQLPAVTTVINANLTVRGSLRFPNETLLGADNVSHDQERYGWGMDGGADYNLDGRPDFAVSAPRTDPSGGARSRVEVYYGAADRSAILVPDWVAAPENGTGFGSALAHGDYNHDGVDDLVVSDTHGFLTNGSVPEAIYLYYGGPAGLPGSPDLVLTYPEINNTAWGWKLAAGIDLDADGYDDLAVTEPGYNEWRSPGCPPARNCTVADGRVWVLWGGPAGLSWSNASLVERLNTTGFADVFAKLGDSDGNGCDELALASPAYDTNRGMVEVISAAPGNRTIRSLWSAYGNTTYHSFGAAVLGGADLMGDGQADLVISDPGANGNAGQLLVYKGDGSGGYGVAPVAVIDTPGLGYNRFGSNLALVGDVEGDGVNRLAVFEPGVGWFGIRSTVYLLDVQNLGSANPPTIHNAEEDFGDSLAGLGDIDSDGLNDFAVGSAYAQNGSHYPGAFAVFFGTRHLWPENVSVSIEGTPFFTVQGALAGLKVTPDFAALFNAYLVGHIQDTDAYGYLNVSIDSSFEAGGTLSFEFIGLAITIVQPPGQVVAAAAAGREAILVSWTPPMYNSDIDAYAIWSNRSGTWQEVGRVDARYTTYFDFAVAFGQFACYRVSAGDTVAGVWSAPSAASCAVADNPFPPAVPQDVSANLSPDGAGIDLTWTTVGGGVDHFEVWRADGPTGNDSHLIDVLPSSRTLHDGGLSQGIEYRYRVRAVGPTGLVSGFSAAATATLGPTAPDPPNLLAALADLSGHSVRLQWESRDARASSFLVVDVDPALPAIRSEHGPTADLSLTVSGLSGAARTFTVYALDSTGRRSGPSNSLTAELKDRMAPATPDGVSVRSPPDGGTLVVSWDPVADPDVVAYRVYPLDRENGSAGPGYFEVPASTLEYWALGLRNHFTYGFQVTAVDGAGNESPKGYAVLGTPESQSLPRTPVVEPLPNVTNLNPLPVRGTSQPGLWVEVWLGGKLTVVAEVSASGDFAVFVPMTSGDNEIWFRAVDPLSAAHPERRASPATPPAHVWLDDEAPRVLRTVPARGATDASIAQRVLVQFSEAVAPETLTFDLLDGEGIVVGGEWVYDASAQTLTFSPAGPLRPGASYSVEVSAIDLAGNRLQRYAFSFTTTHEAPPPPHQEPPSVIGPAAIAAVIVSALAVFIYLRGRRRRSS